MTKISHDSETPAQGQQVITACAFIHQQIDGVEKLFWPKRADTKKFLPGVRELPGGHIDFGEDLITGLCREIKEEFNMTISVGDAFAAFTYANEIKGSHSIEVVFFARFTNPVENIQLNPEDHSTYGWFAEPEIEEQFISSRPGGDDPENAIIRKGFALLRGEKPTF
jgi:8-oxo-dGTP pyrophosphatase MutT (NUDIX family)